MGVDTPLKFLEQWSRYRLSPQEAARITCPSLVIASQGDHFLSFSGQKKLYEAMTCPKTLLEFTAAEDATPHCQMGAMAISNQRVFDWLDQTLDGPR
jgi:alpha-beta hydrolase superfamily lysophospholipase